jgi:hypothetical protein
METIAISKITNNLTNQTVTIFSPAGVPITILPGDTHTPGNWNLSVIGNEGEVSNSTIVTFNVTGFTQSFAYAVVAGRGIVSALGPLGSDFFPTNSHLVHETYPEFSTGDSVKFDFEINELENGDLVTWILGTLDEG